MDMKELVPLLAKGAILLIVLSYGLRTHPRELWRSIQDKRLMIRALLAVYVVVPVTAVVLCLLLPIAHEVKIGIVIMAVSPLAPLVPAQMRKAGGVDTSVALGPYVGLILAAVVIVPLTVALLSAIFPANASIAVSVIARLVAISILVPVAVGLAISSWVPGFARRASQVAAIAGHVILALLVVAVLYKEGGAIISLLGDGSLVAIVVTVVTAVVGGHLLGRPSPSQSRELAMAAAIRHPGIAALIAQQNFSDRRVMLAIILYLLTSAVVATLYQLWASNKSRRAGQAGAAA
jgi:bile acid:Na+ symporter, BASS family